MDTCLVKTEVFDFDNTIMKRYCCSGTVCQMFVQQQFFKEDCEAQALTEQHCLRLLSAGVGVISVQELA